MCHQCDTGQPHICNSSGGVYVSGRGPEFSKATYREGPQLFANNAGDCGAEGEDDDHSDDAISSMSIRSGERTISTEPHLPTRANGAGISDDASVEGLDELDYRAGLK